MLKEDVLSVEIKYEECPENSQKEYAIFTFSDGTTLKYLIYAHSISPFRIILEIIKSKNIYAETTLVDKSYKRIIINKSDAQALIEAIEETGKIRCSHEVDDLGKVNIIRQLPFAVAIKESNRIASQNIFHCIYPSARGGYNIKVFAPYDNLSLGYYSDHDSHIWD